ncbi:hypothetical protein VTK73DRAFT_1916 [Phialemonium thermophilum]|uniref:MutL C-terminal dimerisation domain-containing protein n=1 Tax=Phialemonium thermophilum TaxID=223376 RepID=A0ABR3Y3F8_9PEZI
MSIKPLPEVVAAQIKSGVVVTSLNSVVLGLVKNSLDAGASIVHVSVDYRRGSCCVEDDGHGIAPSEFQQGGGLGKLHFTSKHPPRPDLYGRSGTFLASVASLSLLTVTSHHAESNSHNSLTMHNSKVIARHIPALPEQRVLTFSHGTRVTVQGLFGSMPVRVKRRALELERIGSSRDFDRLTRVLVSMAIPWPGAVHISVREVDGRQVLSLRTMGIEGGCAGSSLVLSRIPKLLAQASLYSGSGREVWVPVGASASGVIINGSVCLTPVATRSLQFISLGLEPISSDTRMNVLYDEVNKVFNDSSFGATERGADEEGKEGSTSITDISRTKDFKTRKGVDRWPIFFLQICLPRPQLISDLSLDHIFDGRGDILSVITDLLRVMTYEFLKSNHFQPKPILSTLAPGMVDPGRSVTPFDETSERIARRRQHSPSSRSKMVSTRSRTPANRHGTHRPLGASRSRPESPFDFWSRVKAGSLLSAMSKGDRESQLDRSAPLAQAPIQGQEFGDSAQRTRQSSPRLVPSRPVGENGTLLRKPSSDTEPNKRTFTPRDRLGECSEIPLKAVCDGGTPLMATPTPVSWVNDVPSTWVNPSFKPAEAPIPREYRGISNSGAVRVSACNHFGFGDDYAVPSIKLLSKISIQALQDADVIGQVDQKFILIRVRPEMVEQKSTLAQQIAPHKSLLVLVDQHAADERLHVESLLKSYFAVSATAPSSWEVPNEALDNPIVFELSRIECQLLCRYKEFFEWWGIFFNEAPLQHCKSKNIEEGSSIIEVSRLPPSILERCCLEPKLLIDLLRNESWKLRDDSGEAVVRDNNQRLVKDMDRDWVRLFHGCPQGIMDLVNSRACRSAIMFNDPLSTSQCRDLIRGLAGSVFPFQCAHGRPSMVPLVDLVAMPSTASSAANKPGGPVSPMELRNFVRKNVEGQC